MKCSVCRDPTIVGFRYKCLQCQNFNMCQVQTDYIRVYLINILLYDVVYSSILSCMLFVFTVLTVKLT